MLPFIFRRGLNFLHLDDEIGIECLGRTIDQCGPGSNIRIIRPSCTSARAALHVDAMPSGHQLLHRRGHQRDATLAILDFCRDADVHFAALLSMARTASRMRSGPR